MHSGKRDTNATSRQRLFKKAVQQAAASSDPSTYPLGTLRV